MNFGSTAKDPNAYWMRPYLDPEVALAGTRNGSWDQYTQRQYPIFDGWNQIVQSLARDDDPRNDLTVAQAREAFDYFHRKEVEIKDPGYEIDLTAAGPLVPGLGKSLGDLRMQASYRGVQEPYFYPQARKAFREDLVQGKLISDLASGRMKLIVHGLYDQQRGTAPFFAINLNNSALPQRGGVPTYPWSSLPSLSSISDHVIFGTGLWSIADVTRWLLGTEFTHALDKNTFYQIWVNRVETDYNNHPGHARNPKIVKVIGQVELDETPFGWTERLDNPLSLIGVEGTHLGTARDTSNIVTWTGKFDLTSQLDRWHLLKAGAEMIAYDYNMNYGDVANQGQVFIRQIWSAHPKQFAAYVQDKIEFNAMIANVGLRFDYFDPSGNWIVYAPFDRAFSAKNRDTRNALLATSATKKQLALSPRLGVSFPLTLNSKLFFNYGHFRQMMTARELFQIEEETRGNVVAVGNPNLSLQRTVAYELGYEQNLFNQLLLRLSGYYRDSDKQPAPVWFVSLDNAVTYTVNRGINYSDVRGFEITVNKNRGKWLRGFANCTFMQFKSGNFGFLQRYESITAQREYELTTTDHYQLRPVSQPYATANLELFTPVGFGPAVFGRRPLADWRLDLLGAWRAGKIFTWAGPGGALIPGLRNNVRMRDFQNLDLRLSKNFKTKFGQMQFFADVNNVLNLKQMYVEPEDPFGGPFEGESDWNDYMKSLHLPAATFKDIDAEAIPYLFIRGNDRVGDYRKAGVAFVPIEIVATAASAPSEPPYLEPGRVVLYYLHDAGTYMQFREGKLVPADPGLVKQVLKDKAYIDMPNESYRTFLNLRSVVLGVRLSI